ncbi:MAG: iron complex outermembrane receptor protein [Litorivivens sp.]|jgi:iron complex outermembrane receptor protein
MFNKHLLLFILGCLSPILFFAQNCNLEISGYVLDVDLGTPISYATIYMNETKQGNATDSLGFFSLPTSCEGQYNLTISHMGCSVQQLYLNLIGDTILTVFLKKNKQLLPQAEVAVQGRKSTTQYSQVINSEVVSQNSDKNLATMLESISGVSTINNGSGISKPVVHGLYGNRLTILNHGIPQSGQQWGADHSPEIDPLVANQITVVKGVGALEYQGSSLGSIVLVESSTIEQNTQTNGAVRYFFESNGRGNGLNFNLQRYGKKMSWRLVGTAKKSGDKRTSKYFLRNSGNEEANVALQLEKTWSKNRKSELYFSSFNAEFGLLRGSQIGNLTDLEEAFSRHTPFFTEDEFSYSIDAPSQKVNHHMLKLRHNHVITEKHKIDFVYAAQYNLRKEFDVRRSGRTDLPAMSLKQISNFFEAKYQNYLANNWELKAGIQLNRVDNENLPETGILPLIPDYISNEGGIFGVIAKHFRKTELEFGARYDLENRKVATISKSLPREIVRYDNDYGSLNTSGGITYEFAENWTAAYNIGYAERNPEINELYSNGLHQGVSGIEEGDPTLKKEVSIKNTFSVKGNIKQKFFVQALLYQQNISDYIFLIPQDEIRLTVRGAFPVFKYEQTDAQLYGFDLMATYQATEKVNLVGKYSYLCGHDQSNSIPLIYMPSNNLYGELNIELPKLGFLQKIEFQLNSKYVFMQRNLLAFQDFVAPPESYNLLGVRLAAEKQMRKIGVKLFVRADNLLNTSYRNYLNRQRYFADDLGFNLVVGINTSF